MIRRALALHAERILADARAQAPKERGPLARSFDRQPLPPDNLGELRQVAELNSLEPSGSGATS